MNIKGKDSGVIFYAPQIYKDRKEDWQIKFLVRRDIEEYSKINLKYFRRRQRVFHKVKHFLFWASKLLMPDFLIGHPNLWDNVKLLAKNPQFKPLRAALAAWLIFSIIAGSTGIYALLNSPSVKASDLWYDASWLYRKQITISNTNIDEDLSHFPLLVKIFNDSDIGAHALSTGYDIRFTDSSGNILPYEREDFSINSGAASGDFWVRTPVYHSPADGQNIVYIYYGNSSADADWTSDTSLLTDCTSITNAQCVWKEGSSQNFTDVMHFGDGTNLNVNDSTSNERDATPGDLVTAVPGPVVGAADMGGNNTTTPQVGAGLSIPSITFSGGRTFSFWLKATTALNTVLAFGNYYYPYHGGGSLYIRDATGYSSNLYAITVGSWYYVTISGDGVNALFYKNGDYVNTIADKSPSINLLGRGYANSTYSLNGAMDEVRISSTARSAAWIKFEYHNQADAGNNLTFAAEELSNRAPNAPTNSSPTDTVANQSLTPTLTSSAFSDNDVGDTHAASQWQISTTSGNYSSTVFDSGEDAVNLTSITVSPALSAGTTYYWHVKHKDNNGNWSSYSTETSFTASQTPATPTNSSPTSGQMNQKTTLTFASSAFSDGDGAAVHSASQWLVRSLSDANYASPAYDSGTDASNLTSIAIPSGNLSENTTYFWKVRHKDDQNIWSSYSSETAFSTGVVPITVIAVGATEYTEGETAKLTVQVKDADGSVVNDATVTINVYNPSGTKVVTAQAMTYLTDSNGLYFYNYTVPSTVGVYIYDVTATYSGETGYSSHTFHVAQFAADITSISSTVSDINTTLQETNKQTKAGILNTETTVQSGDTIKIRYQAESGLAGEGAPEIYVYDGSNNLVIAGASMTEMASSGIYNYSLALDTGWGTGYYTIAVSETTNNTSGNMSLYVGDYDLQSIGSTLNAVSSNMDILIGAFIVTQSAVNDASATTTSFITDLTNSTNDFYNNSVLTFTSGNLNGQVRRISDYNGATKTITLDPALTSAPANNDTFTIVKQNVRVEEQATDIQTDVEAIQTDVTYIRGKVDDIYTLLGTVDTNLSSVQSAVNNIRTSQQKAYKANLSDAVEVQTGNTYYAKLTLLDYEDNPVAAAATPTITIYDSERTVKVNAQNMTADSTGVYSYSYAIPSDGTTGLWEIVVTTAVGSQTNQQLNDYFNVTGSPAQVLINSISDTTISTISADVTITNEGSGDYEYQYEWCVVEDQENQCGGNDDTYYASAAKLIQTGQDFDTTLSATVSTVGTYWFKLVVYYGTEASGASRQFTAVLGGGGGGGGLSYAPSQTVTVDTLNTQIISMQKTVETQSMQLAKALDAIGIIKPIILSSGSEQLSEIKDVQNKLADLQAVSSTIRQVVEQNSVAPIVETYMKFNSVDISFLITNPASTKQNVNFKSFLPAEVKSEHITNLDGLKLEYDANANSYFVSGSISLAPKQSIAKTVAIKDIWVFDDSEFDSIIKQVASFNEAVKNTQYSAQAVLLENNIEDLVNRAQASQKASYTSPQDHILAYRENKGRMQMAQNDLDKLKDLVVQAGASQGLVGKIGGIQTFATWGIVLAIVFGFLLMGAIVFSMWRYQVVLAAKLIDSNNQVLSRSKRKGKR